MTRCGTGLAVLFLASGAAAAPVPEGPGAEDSVSLPAARLLQHRQVQKELKLTAEQRLLIIDGLQDVDEAQDKKIEMILRKPNVPDEEVQAAEREHVQKREKLLTEFAAKQLTTAKRTRLRQIYWHLRGVEAFKDPRVVKALQLTADQKEALDALMDQVTAKVGDFQNAPAGEEEDKVKVELMKLRADVLKKADAALDPEQRAAWKAMRGEPIAGFNADDFWVKMLADEEPMP